MNDGRTRMIDRWFPCTAVDEAVGTPEGSGRSEKAIFTWFASRPIAQARAAVLVALLDDDPRLRGMVVEAVKGNANASRRLVEDSIRTRYPENRPVVADVFSGRAMIPLEAAKLGLRVVGLDYSPVATLAGQLLADYPLRDWEHEPPLPFEQPARTGLGVGDEPRLLRDVRTVLAEVGQRMRAAMAPLYPCSSDGGVPWGYLWAITIPCDACGSRFPLVGSLILRHPYHRTDDTGQSFRIAVDGDEWRIEVVDGPSVGIPTLAAATGARSRGKSGRCPFCGHLHSLDAIKAKGFAGQYEDVPLLVAESEGDGDTRKIFRLLCPVEMVAAATVRRDQFAALDPLGPFPAVPHEAIPVGNEDTVRASGYGFRSYGDLMNPRQTLQFVEVVRAIRACHNEMLAAGVSDTYATALTGYAAANLVRCIRNATRGARLRAHGNPEGGDQNRVQVDHIFSEESKIAFQFDYFEVGPGTGPGTWDSVSDTGVKALARHLRGLHGRPARIIQGTATALPFRDGTVDAVITDPLLQHDRLLRRVRPVLCLAETDPVRHRAGTVRASWPPG